MEEETKTYRVEGEFEIRGTANMDIYAESQEEAEEKFNDFFEYTCLDYPKNNEFGYSGNTDIDVEYGAETIWVSNISEVPYEQTEVERLREKVAELEEKLNKENQ